jgi:hypothetical protein
MDIYKPVGCSTADRDPSAAQADRHVLATWPTCMLLFRACGAPRNKFRSPEMHFQSSMAYVTHPYKFRGMWCI